MRLQEWEGTIQKIVDEYGHEQKRADKVLRAWRVKLEKEPMPCESGLITFSPLGSLRGHFRRAAFLSQPPNHPDGKPVVVVAALWHNPLPPACLPLSSLRITRFQAVSE